MSGDIGISVREISKRMADTEALRGVSIDFGAGLLHGVIGPEGAGKTTLLRLMMGLLRPDSGSIEIRSGQENMCLNAIRSEIAYMPQSQSLYPDLSCSEHLDFFRSLYGLPDSIYRKRRQTLLEITRLEKFQDRKAGQLSGGMYKKLGLMCSLLQSPRAVLLDEPTNGVDPISRREFWSLLYDLRQQGVLVIVTTAYMDEAERCDRVHVLDQGRLLSEGDPQAVLTEEGVRNFDELFLKRADQPIGRPG
jgi:ABC-2 type transport system ATP-binding protein